MIIIKKGLGLDIRKYVSDVDSPLLSVGRSGAKCLLNAATGNFVYFTQDIIIKGPGLDISFGRTYNSLAKTSWSFSYSRKLLNLNQEKAPILYVGDDQSEYQFIWSSKNNTFTAIVGDKAQLSLSFDSNAKQWVLLDCGSGAQEVYNHEGRLLALVDIFGNTVTLGYAGPNLVKIINSNGEGLRFEYKEGNLVGLYQLEDEGFVLLGEDDSNRLLTYNYQSNLLSSCTIHPTTPSQKNYICSFKYVAGRQQLAEICESDQSVIYLKYNADQLTSFQNKGKLPLYFDYQQGKTVVKMSGRVVYEYQFAAHQLQSQITELGAQKFEFTKCGQTQRIIYPAGNSVRYTYGDRQLTVAVEQLDASGVVIGSEYVRYEGVKYQRPIAARGMHGERQAIIYDESFIFALFEINEHGRVFEFGYDKQGSITSRKMFQTPYKITTDFFDLMDNQARLTEMKRLYSDRVVAYDVIRFERDIRGQLVEQTMQFIRGGKAEQYQKHYRYDFQGLLAFEAVGNSAGYVREYDNLHTLRSVKNPSGQMALYQYDYLAQKQVVTLVSGLNKSISYSPLNLEVGTHLAETHLKISRETSTVYDALGNPTIDINQGVVTYHIYDLYSREVASILPDGTLIEYLFDINGNQFQTRTYAEKVDASKLGVLKGEYIAKDVIDSLRPKDQPAERVKVSSKFYDLATGNVIAEISHTGAVVTKSYDNENRLVQVVEHALRIDPDVNQSLKIAEVIKTSVNDRVTKYTKGAGDRTITCVMPDGLCISYQYDVSGHICEKRQHTLRIPSADLGHPEKHYSDDDSVETYLYNEIGKEVAYIDADGYVTIKSYNSNGLIDTESVLKDKVKDRNANQIGGLGVELDKTAKRISYQYDVKQRLKEKRHTNGLCEQYVYDADDNIILYKSFDGRLDAGTTQYNATLRGYKKEYDQFGQLRMELTGEGFSLYAKELEHSRLETIVQKHATFYDYDNAGRISIKKEPGEYNTVYYYDVIGRVRFIIKPDGGIVEKSYDDFGYLAQERYLVKLCNPKDVEKLEGGELTQSVKDILVKYYDEKDLVSSVKTDFLTGTQVVTDGLGYETIKIQNVFGEEQSQAFVVEKGLEDTITTINTTYDSAGRVLKISKAQLDNSHSQTKNYDELGRLREEATPEGVKTTYTYYPSRKLETTRAQGVITRYTYDALGRLSKATKDPEGLSLTTRYRYIDDKGIVEVTNPEGVITSEVTNVYGDVIDRYDAAGNKTSFEYNGAGRVTKEVSPLNRIKAYLYDEHGQLIYERDEVAKTTRYRKDRCHRNLEITVSIGAVKEVTQLIYDGAGQVVSRVNVDQTKQTIDYNARGDVSVISSKLGDNTLVKKYTYSGQRNAEGKAVVISETHESDSQTRSIAYEYDIDGHCRTKTVDKLGINAQEKILYNSDGQIVKQIGPEGTTVSTEFSDDGRVLTKTNKFGGVVNYTYDVVGRKISEAQGDSLTLFVYDRADKIIYTIKNGRATQHLYDQCGRPSGGISYLNPIHFDLDDLPINTESVAEKIAPNENDQYQRIVYDGDGRVRFEVDSRNIVTETRYGFDGTGVLFYTTTIKYSMPATIGKAWGVTEKADLDKLMHGLSEDHAENRWQTSYKDKIGREVLLIDERGYVTETIYEDLGSLEKTARSVIKYYDAMPQVEGEATRRTYAKFQAFKASKRDNPDKDLTTITSFYISKQAKSVQQKTKVRQEKETYVYDGFGNRVQKTDRAGLIWRYQFDALDCEIFTIKPDADYVHIAEDESGILSSSKPKEMRITEHCKYYKNRQLKEKVQKCEGYSSQVTTYKLDKGGDISHQIIAAVSIFNPEKYKLKADKRTLFETDENDVVQEYQLKDRWGRVYCRFDMENGLNYYVFNKHGEVAYQLDALGGVVYYQYNGLGQKVREVKFSKQIDFTKFDYENPCDETRFKKYLVMSAVLIEASENRIVEYLYDQSGLVSAELTNEIEVYICLNGYEKLVKSRPETRYSYNHFGELIKRASRITPGESADAFVFALYALDKAGNQVEVIDEQGYVTRLVFDRNNREVYKYEYAKPTPEIIFPIAKLELSDEDRLTTCDYDGFGRLATRIDHNYHYYDVAESTTLARKKEIGDKLHRVKAERVTTYLYDEHGEIYAEILPNKQIKINLRDKLGRVVIEGDEGELSVDPADPLSKPIILTKLTRRYYDRTGQVAKSIQLATGVVLEIVDGTIRYNNSPELPISSESDRESLYLYSSAGLLLSEQNPERYAEHRSYNKFGKVARIWSFVEQYQQSGTVEMSLARQLRQTDFLYDNGMRAISESKLINGKFESITITYNAFSEVVARGVGEKDNEVIFYNQLGKISLANTDNGVYRIHRQDMLGHETLSIASQTLELNKMHEQSLAQVMDEHAEQLMVTRYQVSANGNVEKIYRPRFRTISPSLGVSLTVHDKQFGYNTISWPVQEDKFIKYKITLYDAVSGKEIFKYKNKDVITKGNRNGIELEYSMPEDIKYLIEGYHSYIDLSKGDSRDIDPDYDEEGRIIPRADVPALLEQERMIDEPPFIRARGSFRFKYDYNHDDLYRNHKGFAVNHLPGNRVGICGEFDIADMQSIHLIYSLDGTTNGIYLRPGSDALSIVGDYIEIYLNKTILAYKELELIAPDIYNKEKPAQDVGHIWIKKEYFRQPYFDFNQLTANIFRVEGDLDALRGFVLEGGGSRYLGKLEYKDEKYHLYQFDLPVSESDFIREFKPILSYQIPGAGGVLEPVVEKEYPIFTEMALSTDVFSASVFEVSVEANVLSEPKFHFERHHKGLSLKKQDCWSIEGDGIAPVLVNWQTSPRLGFGDVSLSLSYSLANGYQQLKKDTINLEEINGYSKSAVIGINTHNSNRNGEERFNADKNRIFIYLKSHGGAVGRPKLTQNVNGVDVELYNYREVVDEGTNPRFLILGPFSEDVVSDGFRFQVRDPSMGDIDYHDITSAGSQVIQIAGNLVVIDVSSLDSPIYDYQFTAKTKSGKPLNLTAVAGPSADKDGWFKGRFANAPENDFIPLPEPVVHDWQYPLEQNDFDRWGNITCFTDAEGGQTLHQYDRDNQVIFTRLPAALAHDEDGDSIVETAAFKYRKAESTDWVKDETGRSVRPPVYRYELSLRDIMGRQFGKVDAKNHIWIETKTISGTSLYSLDPDGIERWHHYSVFRELSQIMDAAENRTLYVRNKCGSVLSIQYPRYKLDDRHQKAGNAIQRYKLNQAQERISDTSPQGVVRYMGYDELAHHSDDYEYAFLGGAIYHTRRTYNLLGHKVALKDAEGEMEWQYDYFGRELGHLDRAGTQHNNIYNHAGLVIQSVTAVPYLETDPPEVRQAKIKASWRKNPTDVTAKLDTMIGSIGYSEPVEDRVLFDNGTLIPAKYIQNIYDQAGQLVVIFDVGNRQETRLKYDRSGNEIYHSLVHRNGVKYRDINVKYSALGEQEEYLDLNFHMSRFYDLCLNRAVTDVLVRSKTPSALDQPHTYYYKYSHANRITVAKGGRHKGKVGLKDFQGNFVTDARELSYDAVRGLRYHEIVVRKDKSIQHRFFHHDPSDRVSLVSSGLTDDESDASTLLQFILDGDNHLRQSKNYDVDTEPHPMLLQATLVEDHAQVSRHLFGQLAIGLEKDVPCDTLTNERDNHTGLVKKQIARTYDSKEKRYQNSVTHYQSYTPSKQAGRVNVESWVEVEDSVHMYSRQQNRYMPGDQMLEWQSLATNRRADSSGITESHSQMVRDSKLRPDLFFDEINIKGDRRFIHDGFDQVSCKIHYETVDDESLLKSKKENKRLIKGYEHFYFASNVRVGTAKFDKDGVLISYDFDQNYMPVTSENYGGMDAVVAQRGQSFARLALMLYCDPDLAERLAEENGYSFSTGKGTVVLKDDEYIHVLTRPLTIHNNNKTQWVVNTARIYGGMQPTLPPAIIPKPPSNLFQTLVSMFVSAVMTKLFGPVLGDLASQGLLMAMGIQEEFSWQSLAMAQVSAEISFFTGPQMSPVINNRFVKAGLYSAATKMIYGHSGKSFYTSALAGQLIGEVAETSLINVSSEQLVRQVMTGAVEHIGKGIAQASIAGQNSDWGIMVAQGLGQALGNYAVERGRRTGIEPALTYESTDSVWNIDGMLDDIWTAHSWDTMTELPAMSTMPPDIGRWGLDGVLDDIGRAHSWDGMREPSQALESLEVSFTRAQLNNSAWNISQDKNMSYEEKTKALTYISAQLARMNEQRDTLSRKAYISKIDQTSKFQGRGVGYVDGLIASEMNTTVDALERARRRDEAITLTTIKVIDYGTMVAGGVGVLRGGYRAYKTYRAYERFRAAQEIAIVGEVAGKGGQRFSGVGASRNVLPLTEAQQTEVLEYAQSLGTSPDKIKFYSYDAPTNYSDMLDTVFVGPDIFPGVGSGKTVLDRMTMRSTLAHEIVGHRYTTIVGKDFAPGSLLDEVQASYRAAKLAPDLSNVERYQLLKDVVRRLHNEGVTVRQFKATDFDKMFLDDLPKYRNTP